MVSPVSHRRVSRRRQLANSRWVRTTSAIHTHFFSAIRAFTQLELMRAEELIENWYERKRNLSQQERA